MENSLLQIYKNSLPVLLHGCLITIGISFVGIFFGFFAGAILGILDCEKKAANPKMHTNIN